MPNQPANEESLLKAHFETLGDSAQVEFAIWEREDPDVATRRLSRAEYIKWVANDISGLTNTGTVEPGISNYAPGPVWYPHGFTTAVLNGRSEVAVPVSTHPNMVSDLEHAAGVWLTCLLKHRESLLYLLLASVPLAAFGDALDTPAHVKRVRGDLASGTAVYMPKQGHELGSWRGIRPNSHDRLINAIAHSGTVNPVEGVFPHAPFTIFGLM